MINEFDEAAKDALVHGTGYMKDGKRINPKDVYNSEDDLINEAVARKLGWTLGDCEAGGECWSSEPGDSCRTLKFATDISAAWEIVALLLVRGLQVRVDMRKTFTDVLIFEPNAPNNVNLASEQADTAPRAICKAFLKLP